MTSVAPAPQGAAHELGPAAPDTAPRQPRQGTDAVIGLVLAGALVVLAFITTGGFDTVVKAGDTWSDVVVVVLGTGACCAVAVYGARSRAWGGATVSLFAALTALTALSIAWSVQPDISWQAASQMLAYLAAFAGAAALARLVPERWPAVVIALAAASVALSAYGLLVKVFPATLDAGDALGRLQSPFGYWNAVGVMAALGLMPCLWVGSSRRCLRVLRALAVPGLALLIAVVVLSYSRSAALVAVLGVGGWFALVPLRLRATAVLAFSAAGGATIAVWALNTHALTADRVPLGSRDAAGHTFGVVLVVVVALMCAAGWALSLALDRIALPDRTRRRVGVALLVCVALLPVAGIGALATSSRGLTGQISHVWSTLTQSGRGVGDNAGRLLQLSNSRPLYWSEGITVGEHALLGGVGAEGYATARTAYTTNSSAVSHAHSYLIQTFADFGLIGLAVNLALLVAWAIAVARTLAPRIRWKALGPERRAEREGLITLLTVALAFGVQSAIDWTWFFTGVATAVLICAGWLAGRGPLSTPVGRAPVRRPIRHRPATGAVVTALVALALLGSWAVWQPLRSADAVSASLTAAASGDTGQAFTDARDAAHIDPVAIEPLQILSSLYTAVRDMPAARAELVQATQRQPDNPQTWLWLGVFDRVHGDLRGAYASLLRALRLDKTDSLTIGELNATLTELGLPPA